MTAKNSKKWHMRLLLDDDVHTWLTHESKRLRRSMGNVILCILDEYIESREVKEGGTQMLEESYSRLIGVRFTQSELELLEELARKNNTTVVNLVRKATLAYIEPEK